MKNIKTNNIYLKTIIKTMKKMQKPRWKFIIVSLFKFALRLFITVASIILAKSLFLCWYYNTFSLDDLIFHVKSISNQLLAIGIATSHVLNTLLNIMHFKFPSHIK